jgi:hypothetical protein
LSAVPEWSMTPSSRWSSIHFINTCTGIQHCSQKHT